MQKRDPKLLKEKENKTPSPEAKAAEQQVKKEPESKEKKPDLKEKKPELKEKKPEAAKQILKSPSPVKASLPKIPKIEAEVKQEPKVRVIRIIRRIIMSYLCLLNIIVCHHSVKIFRRETASIDDYVRTSISQQLNQN